MQIWPSIDICGGHCVRTLPGDSRRHTIYGDSPADMAARFQADGASGIHVVDLDRAQTGSPINARSIEALIHQVNVPVQIAGGLRSFATIERYLESGAQHLIIDTPAVTDWPWTLSAIDRYPNSILISLSARGLLDGPNEWDPTGIIANVSQHPIAGILYNDHERETELNGPDFDAVRRISKSTDVPLIVSGGISSQDDIIRLAESGTAGCVIGRALYEGHLTLAQATTASEAGALPT